MNCTAFAPSSPLSLRGTKQHSKVVLRCPSTPRWNCSLVAVAGATGGVGRLVVDRLLASIATNADLKGPVHTSSSAQHLRITGVRALSRNVDRARATLQQNPALSVVPISSTAEADSAELRAALLGVAVVVICTGTTAFPTRAWRGGNTPKAVDDRGVLNLVNAVDLNTIKRVVLVSSIGTMRASQFPFSILNAFGVVDAKRRGELHVEQAAREGGFSYAILRPGRLIGAPHTNVGMLRSEPHPRKLNVQIARGDSQAGDLSRAAAADAANFAARWDPAADLDISLVHCEGTSPSSEKWESMLREVQILRNVVESAPRS